MATDGYDLTSDEIINLKCCVCAEENRTTEADKYCLECKDYFCSSCVGIHRKIPSTRGHKILGKDDFKSLRGGGCLPSYPTERCPQHPLEVVNLYCKDHDEVACASCIALSHRSCRHVVSISEDIDNLYKNIDLNSLEQKISQTKKTMEDIKKSNETKLQEVKAALNTEIGCVKAYRQKLQTQLDQMEQKTIQELTREFYSFEASLADDTTKVKSLLSSLNATASQLKKSEGNLAQVFVCAKILLKLVIKAEEAGNRQVGRADETISFMPDQSIEGCLLQNKGLGKVVKNKTDQRQVTLYQEQAPIESLYTVSQVREINIKLPNDTKLCSIWGSCITEDGFLLLADFLNNKLQRFDMSTEQVKDYVECVSSPMAVSSVSKTEAVVTLNNCSIQFVSQGDKMSATQTLKMKHVCGGLAHKDGKLFVSDWGKTVYIYDRNGQELHKINKDGQGKDIFSSSQLIAVSGSGDRVFVADYNNGIIVLDTQGNYISTLTTKNTSHYQGVCTDGRNIFLGDCKSNKIVQFGHDFKMLGELGKVVSPFSLCFDYRNMRLIATLLNNNKIIILDLK